MSYMSGIADWHGWSLAVKNLVVPVFCRACGVRLLTEDNLHFCPTCWEQSPRIERPFCTVCGRPHAGAVGFGTRSNFPCADCRSQPPKHVRRVWGAAKYDGPVGEAIRLLKFNGRRRLARPLAEMMAAFAEVELSGETFDVLVPVPLHRVRFRARGFNQSALLAELLSPILGLPISYALWRVRPTRIQSLLNEGDRPANIVGAFGVAEDHPFQNARILLLDDVVTTGSTVVECASALRRTGAREVCVFAAAMAV